MDFICTKVHCRMHARPSGKSTTSLAAVSKHHEFCSKTEELGIKNEECCVKKCSILQSWISIEAQSRIYSGEYVYITKSHNFHLILCLNSAYILGVRRYTINGVSLGVAFEAVMPQQGEKIYPAMTLQGGPHWIRFGRRELK